MYEYIKGTIERIGVGDLVIECGGIGYHLYASTHVTERLSLHEEAKLYTHLSVREDDMSLFGFLSADELAAFRMLISVSGIGPKGAVAVLSELTVDDLRIAVLSDDHKSIAKAQGIGPKTAQKVVLELRDKMKLEDVFSESEDESMDLPASKDTISETAMALSSLGYSNVEALRAIKKVQGAEGMTVEELLKAALKHML